MRSVPPLVLCALLLTLGGCAGGGGSGGSAKGEFVAGADRVCASHVRAVMTLLNQTRWGPGAPLASDAGTWTPESPDVDTALKKGDLKFSLQGKKLRGSWVIVRTRGRYQGSGKTSWLLIKHRDEFATTKDVAEEEPRSVVSKE